ncbi:hypothetical protein HYT57_03595 [Candidatus Woesearchaeota archaeon]|nr:hypothetical protein [Candidatus Woesearchaeota archaeon]
MEREEFSKQEKEFFRSNFSRLNRNSIDYMLKDNELTIQYIIDHPSSFGYIMEFPTGILMTINRNSSQEEIDLTIIHEMLHPHYETYLGKTLFEYLCEKYGELMDHWGILFFDGKKGKMYHNQWESFLDEEAVLLQKEDPGLAQYIKSKSTEIIRRPQWRGIYVRGCERSLNPFKGATLVWKYR